MGCCDFNGNEALASDMIFEILSRSSLTTMQRCKKVSKSMKQIIYRDPTFLPLHCQRTHSIFGYFFQATRVHRFATALVSGSHSREGSAAIGANWPYDNLQILASSDEGILLCLRRGNESSPYANQYYASKPATNQWQQLPDPVLRYETDATAVVVIESDPLRYVVIRLAGHGMKDKCEIFDSETRTWEKIECEMPYGCIVGPRRAGVTVSQSVKWLTLNSDNVLAFDLIERSFRCFPLPETAPYCEWKQLVEYEGGLGFAGLIHDEVRSCMELWVAEKRQPEWEWRREMAVDMAAVTGTTWGPQPVDFCSSDVAFTSSEDKTGFYNLRDGSFSGVEVPNALRGSSKQIFRFRSDFEIVNLKGGREYV